MEQIRNRARRKLLLWSSLLLAAAFLLTAFGTWRIQRIHREEQIALLGRLVTLCPENTMSLLPAFLTEKTADDVQKGMAVMEKSGYTSIGYQELGLTESAGWCTMGIFSAFVLAGIFLAMQYRGQRKRLQELRVMGEYLAGDWMKPPEFSQPEYCYLRQCALQGTARLQKEKAANEREKQELAKYLENISHQIKTPLAGVSLCQEYLESVETDEEKKRMLKESEKQIESIRSLVMQLLQKARLDAGRASMKLERVTLARLMERVNQTVRYLSVEKGVRLEWQYEPEQQLLCDCFWVQEALINLIKNAAENTPDGGCVEIIVSRKDSRTDFEVRDSGPGIDPAEKENIFRRFYTKTVTETGANAGIGLNLASEIAMMQGGRLVIVDHEGPGAWFRLQLYL